MLPGRLEAKTLAIQGAKFRLDGFSRFTSRMNPLFSLPAFVAQAESAPSNLSPFLMIGLFMAAMYFFMIAPQRKKEKTHKAMLAALKNGDKVITIGGIYGTVTAIKDDRIHIKVDDSTRLEMLRSSIQTLQSSGEAK